MRATLLVPLLLAACAAPEPAWKVVITDSDFIYKTLNSGEYGYREYLQAVRDYEGLRRLFDAKAHPEEPLPIECRWPGTETIEKLPDGKISIRTSVSFEGAPAEVHIESGGKPRRIVMNWGFHPKALLHELTHVVMALEMPDPHRHPWLSEGVAGYVERSKTGTDGPELILPLFEELARTFSIRRPLAPAGAGFFTMDRAAFYGPAAEENYMRAALVAAFYLERKSDGSFRSRFEKLALLSPADLVEIEREALAAPPPLPPPTAR